MKNIPNWIKHDCLELIVDIVVLVLCFVDKLDLYTIFLVLFVILSTIQHYKCYCKYKDKE